MVASPCTHTSRSLPTAKVLRERLGDPFSEALTTTPSDDERSVQSTSNPGKPPRPMSKCVRFRANEYGQILRHVYTYPSAKNCAFANEVYWTPDEMAVIRQECRHLVESNAHHHPYYLEYIETIFKASQNLLSIDSELTNAAAMFPIRGLEIHASRFMRNKKQQARKDILMRYNHLVYHTDLQDDEIALMLSEFSQLETRGSRFYAAKMGQADRNEADSICL